MSPRDRCEQPGVRGTGGGAGHLGHRLPQRGRAKHGIAVEEQAPGGIRVGDALQAGGLAGFVQSRGAFFIGNELGCRLAGGTGILHQPQAVDAVPAGIPAEKQAAGGPVIKVKASAGKGGGGAQAISTPGAVEKVLVAGHGAGQGELGEKILVRLAQAEHKGGITTRLNARGLSRAAGLPARRRCSQWRKIPPHREKQYRPGTSAGTRTRNPRL